MKIATNICIALFVLIAGLGLMQLWLSAIDGVIFTKLIITLCVLFVVVLGVALARREYVDDKKLKQNDYIE